MQATNLLRAQRKNWILKRLHTLAQLTHAYQLQRGEDMREDNITKLKHLTTHGVTTELKSNGEETRFYAQRNFFITCATNSAS